MDSAGLHALVIAQTCGDRREILLVVAADGAVQRLIEVFGVSDVSVIETG